jgi:importin subunit alpha-1
VSGNAKQTQKVIEMGGLDYLKRALLHEKKSMRKETCWIISNLAAGTSTQVEALIRNDYLPTLQQILNGDDLEVIKSINQYLPF